MTVQSSRSRQNKAIKDKARRRVASEDLIVLENTVTSHHIWFVSEICVFPLSGERRNNEYIRLFSDISDRDFWLSLKTVFRWTVSEDACVLAKLVLFGWKQRKFTNYEILTNLPIYMRLVGRLRDLAPSLFQPAVEFRSLCFLQNCRI